MNPSGSDYCQSTITILFILSLSYLCVSQDATSLFNDTASLWCRSVATHNISALLEWCRSVGVVALVSVRGSVAVVTDLYHNNHYGHYHSQQTFQNTN